MELPIAIVRHWFAEGEPVLRAVAAGRGFSGARLWQVEHAGRLVAMRQWPLGVQAERLASIHKFQRKLATNNLPVPAPLETSEGATYVKAGRHFWELAPWMLGAADYWSDPRPAKLDAALRMLARIHLVALPKVERWEMPALIDNSYLRWGPLPSRIEKLNGLVYRRDVNRLRGAIDLLPAEEREPARLALELIERLGPRELVRSARWDKVDLPHGMCLRDIWHDHVLFTGDEVTGVIDFGAAEGSAPAADIARLLGSMVGDDQPRWAAGLAAYESVRPLTDEEREAVRFFDATGVVLSAANWLQWLYGPSASRLAGTFERNAALGRFNILVGRLRHLEDAGV
ncbi:MAG TPA: phosphotransferase [Lacipirellula sp.]